MGCFIVHVMPMWREGGQDSVGASFEVNKLTSSLENDTVNHNENKREKVTYYQKK